MGAAPKPVTVRVAVPPAGDANLTVVQIRGRLPALPRLTNLRRLPPSVLVLVATRQQRNGWSEVWLAVLTRGPGAARALASTDAPGGGHAEFNMTGLKPRSGELRRQSYLSVSDWDASPPARCAALNPDNRRDPRNPRFIRALDARTDQVIPLTADEWFNIVLREACDQPISPGLAARWGIPHTDFSLRQPAPNEVALDGVISADSNGYLLTPVPAGIVGLRGSDAARCEAGSRGSEQYVLCAVTAPAGDRVELTLDYGRQVDAAQLRRARSAMFTRRNRQVGPFFVSGPP
jgi:hypothetical protein